MEELTEVITAAEFHPKECNMFVYSSSKGSIRLCDMREQALCDKHAKSKFVCCMLDSLNHHQVILSKDGYWRCLIRSLHYPILQYFSSAPHVCTPMSFHACTMLFLFHIPSSTVSSRPPCLILCPHTSDNLHQGPGGQTHWMFFYFVSFSSWVFWHPINASGCL